MRAHNRVWLLVILLGWLALLGYARLTDGFVHHVNWYHWEIGHP